MKVILNIFITLFVFLPAVTYAQQQQNISNCGEGYISNIYGECVDIDEINNTAIGHQISSSIAYGVGTLYSSIAGISWSITGYSSYEYLYGGYSEYPYYSLEKYHDEFFVALAPQSAIMLIFGGINQGAKSKQITVLNELGEEHAKGLVVAGAVLYGAGLGTTTLNILSALKDNQQFTVSTSIINAAVLLSSFIVNNLGYVKQKKMIKKATAKIESQESVSKESKISLSPYFGYFDNTGSAGLVMKF